MCVCVEGGGSACFMCLGESEKVRRCGERVQGERADEVKQSRGKRSL